MDQSSAPRFRIPRDVWIGLIALAFGAWYWTEAGDIPISPLDGIVNAAALPRMLAVAMMLFSVLLILRALVLEVYFLNKARKAASPLARPVEEGRDFTTQQHLKAAGIIVIGIVYLLVLPWLGYVLSATALILVTSLYIGARAGLYTLGVAVGLAAIFYLIFVKLLSIPLPAGFWPSLLG